MKKEKLILLFVLVTLIGYWYNLGVVNYSVMGENELRLYDLTFPFLILFFLSDKSRKYYVNKVIFLKRVFDFSKWVTATLIITFLYMVLYYKLVTVFQAVLYVFHLWGFVITGYYSFILCNKKKENINILIYGFIILHSIENILLIGQLIGQFPLLWPQVYLDAYGDLSPSGTLGPNRIVPGMMTFLGIIVSLFTILNRRYFRLSITFYLFVLTNIFLGVLVVLLLGSKTTLVAFSVFVLTFLFSNSVANNIKIIISGTLILLITISFWGIPDVIKERFEFISSRRDFNKKNLTEGNVIEVYEANSAGRASLLFSYIELTIEQFYFIPFGSGVYNLHAKKGKSAHNMYLSLLNETGIVGLVLFLRWLFSYMKSERRILTKLESGNLTRIIIPLVYAMLISLLAGEHLYIYRPLFAILGTFIFVVNIMLATYLNSYGNQ